MNHHASQTFQTLRPGPGLALALGLGLTLAASPSVTAGLSINTGSNIRFGSISVSTGADDPVENGYAVTPSDFGVAGLDACVTDVGREACMDSTSQWLGLGPGGATTGFMATGKLVAQKGPGPGFANASETIEVSLVVSGLAPGQGVVFSFSGWLDRVLSVGSVSLVGPGVDVVFDTDTSWNQLRSLTNGTYTLKISGWAHQGFAVGSRSLNYGVELKLGTPPGCGAPGAGSCFVEHGPGCDDSTCCAVVCGLDLLCCTAAWDATCVDRAIANCPIRFHTDGIIDPRTGHRHRLISPAPWGAAQGLAAAHGQSLTTVGDAKENAWLLGNLLNNLDGTPKSAWIGLVDPIGIGQFTWASGAPVDYVQWTPGEPAPFPSDRFALMDDLTGGWSALGSGSVAWGLSERQVDACVGNTWSCFELAPFSGRTGCDQESCCHVICEVDSFCCVHEWDQFCIDEAGNWCQPQIVAGPIVNPATGHRYYLLGGCAWSEAERTANEMGGHLASIGSHAENEWIRLNFQKFAGVDRKPFVGLHDQAFEGIFRWVDHAPLTYLNWAPGEPSNDFNLDHAYMKADGRWAAVRNATQGHHAILEVPCLGDLDGDGEVGGADLGLMLAAWSPAGASSVAPADLNRDGVVDGGDMGLLLGSWGPCPVSNCCGAWNGTGCDQPACSTCICAFDLFCCHIQWDGICAEESANECLAACQCGG